MKESVLDKMLVIVEEYRGMPEDVLRINRIMYLRKQLSTYLVTFSTEIGDVRKKWKSNEVRVEIEKNQKRIEYIDKGTTKADWFSRANLEEELNSEAKWEAEYWRMDYLFKSFREVLSDMNQKVSYLKEEEKQEKFYNK